MSTVALGEDEDEHLCEAADRWLKCHFGRLFNCSFFPLAEEEMQRHCSIHVPDGVPLELHIPRLVSLHTSTPPHLLISHLQLPRNLRATACLQHTQKQRFGTPLINQHDTIALNANRSLTSRFLFRHLRSGLLDTCVNQSRSALSGLSLATHGGEELTGSSIQLSQPTRYDCQSMMNES